MNRERFIRPSPDCDGLYQILEEVQGLRSIVVPISAILILYFSKKGLTTAVSLIEVYAFCILSTVPIGLLSYLSMRANFPLQDQWLMGMDSSLGFNWVSFVGFIDSHSYLARLLGLSYRSFIQQLMIVPLLLVFLNQTPRAYRMVIGYFIICAVASAISMFFPALGTYTMYGSKIGHLDNIDSFFGYAFLNEFHAVRENSNFVFEVSKMGGLLTFPSVHAALAYLCAWAAWGSRIMRYPFLILNCFMATSAISHANHYFVDVLAGFVVAIVSIGLTNMVIASTPILTKRSIKTI